MTDPSRPRGTGPGVITPDGCAVDFYARMDRYLTDNHGWLRAVPG